MNFTFFNCNFDQKKFLTPLLFDINWLDYKHLKNFFLEQIQVKMLFANINATANEFEIFEFRLYFSPD